MVEADNMQQLEELAKELFEDGGIGIHPESRFVHVDVGPRRRWSY